MENFQPRQVKKSVTEWTEKNDPGTLILIKMFYREVSRIYTARTKKKEMKGRRSLSGPGRLNIFRRREEEKSAIVGEIR